MSQLTDLDEGVWLVQQTRYSKGASRIIDKKKLGGLKGVYPFAQMMEECDLLTEYIREKGYSDIFGSLEFPQTGGCVYYPKSFYDNARDILEFLSKPRNEKEKILKKMNIANGKLDSEDKLRDLSWDNIPKNDIEEINAKISIKKREIEKLKQQKEILLYETL